MAKALAASVIGSVALAILFAQSRLIERAFYPFAVALQVTPIVSIAPLLLIYLSGPVAVLVCAFLVSFFPLLANTTLGLSSADQNLVDLFRLYRASRVQELWLLRLPSALPYFLAGLRISGGLALIGAIVAEIAAGTAGKSAGLAYRIVEVRISSQYTADVRGAAAGRARRHHDPSGVDRAFPLAVARLARKCERQRILRGATSIVRRRGAFGNPDRQAHSLVEGARERDTQTGAGKHGLRAHALTARRKHRHASRQAHPDGAAQNESVVTDPQEVLIDVGSAEDREQAFLAADRRAGLVETDAGGVPIARPFVAFDLLAKPKTLRVVINRRLRCEFGRPSCDRRPWIKTSARSMAAAKRS